MQDIPDTNITIFDKQIAKYESERPKTKAQLQYEEAKKGYKIRINWGCLGNCAFCVTRYAEQKLLSKPLDTILTEFKNGLQKNIVHFS
jgi:tRNA A37 methylthiotransferase MiaB